ncbi:MAG: hypothetical protein LC747_02700, partial [Acidobacteria bacterium]|nr:hypothetical protein [Acidobacteriota bacterium]
MKKYFFVIIALLTLNPLEALAQDSVRQTSPPAAAAQQQQTPRPQPARSTTLDLSDYGVQITPEPRLIVMMAALDAAGFDPTPPGRQPSEFRALVRREQANLDADLRARMRRFYELNILK